MEGVMDPVTLPPHALIIESSNTSQAVLTGPVGCGKTTTLFSISLEFARQQHDVIYICNRSKIEKSLPGLAFNAPWVEPALERIHLKYAECSTQLLHFVSGITLCGINPQLIVIDDFSEMIEDCDERAVLKVLALLRELGQPPRHQGSDTPNPQPHVLLAGSNDRGSALSRMQHCLNRWFPLCYTLAGSPALGVHCERVRHFDQENACVVNLKYPHMSSEESA